MDNGRRISNAASSTRLPFLGRHHALRGLTMVLASATALMVFGIGATSAGSPATVSSAASSSWAVGDCYATADVANNEITLSSKVPCTEDHAVQIVAGAPLSKALSKAGYGELRDGKSKTRKALDSFAFNEVCTNKSLAKGAYPENGASIGKALEKVNAGEFIPGAPGGLGWVQPDGFGWVLPDRASFDAGAKDVLCVFGFATDFTGSRGGDVRQLETTAAMPNFRTCSSSKAGETQEVLVRVPISCDEPHVQETVVYLGLDVTGQPKNVTDWRDKNWVKFDKACASIADILIGGTNPEFKIQANTNPAAPLYKLARASKTTARLFSCDVRGLEPGAMLPAGTAIGLGDRKLKVAPAAP